MRERAIVVTTGAALLLIALILLAIEMGRVVAEELRSAADGRQFLPETRFRPKEWL